MPRLELRFWCGAWPLRPASSALEPWRWQRWAAIPISIPLCGVAVTPTPEFRHLRFLRLPLQDEQGELLLKTRIAIGVGLAAFGVVAATSAQAQTVPGNPAGVEAPPMAQPGLPPREVLRIVRASGLTPLTQPARQGPRYVILASDNMGGQLRVVIGALDGRILHAAPAHDSRFAAYPVRPRGYIPIAPQYGAAGPARGVVPPADLREPSAPLPRTAVRTSPVRTSTSPAPADAPQNPRLESAPDVTGSVPTQAAPAPTPLPRPRPAVAANEAAAAQSTPAASAPAASETPAPRPPAAAAKPAPVQPTEMIPVAPLD